MKYALLGDLHSHEENTNKVLKHIEQIASEAIIIGLGDLFECKIGKKNAAIVRGAKLEDAAVYDETFDKLLSFPSVIGNQEERIALVTGLEQFLHYPSQIHIEKATIIHGHQFQWNERFEPSFPTFSTPLVFFGHSHRAAIYDAGERKAIIYDEATFIGDKPYIINVGAVVESAEWCLYDSENMTVTFYKA